VSQVVLTNDGRAISASNDKTLRVWDMETGQCLKVLEGHTDKVDQVTLTGDGRAISKSFDNTLRIWNIETYQCLSVLRGHSYHINDFVITSDGRLISASSDSTVRVWDLETSKCLKVLKHNNHVTHVAMMKDGHVFSASEDDKIRTWNIETGRCTAELKKRTSEAAYFLSQCQPRPDTIDSFWQLVIPKGRRYGHISYLSHGKIASIYLGQFKKVGAASSGDRCIWFDANEPHILHLHRPEFGDNGATSPGTNYNWFYRLLRQAWHLLFRRRAAHPPTERAGGG